MGNFFSKLKGHLIPTARVDKHGRVVIRHMKPEESGVNGARSLIPAPRTKPSAEMLSLASEAASFLSEELSIRKDDEKQFLARTKKALAGFSPETVHRIMAAEKNGERKALIHVNYELAERNPREAYVNDLMRLSGHFYNRGEHIDFIANYIRGLQKYEGLAPMGADGSYPPERRSQGIALVAAVQRLREMSMWEKSYLSDLDYIPDDRLLYAEPLLAEGKLRDLILNATVGERELITRIIEERSIVNADDILEMMRASESAALADGAL